MLDHETIRNASFSLLPTGYNPEQVDGSLEAVAAQVAAGQDPTELVRAITFDVTDVGYAPDEVNEFFARILAEPERAGEQQDAPVSQPHDADETPQPQDADETPQPQETDQTHGDQETVQSEPLAEQEQTPAAEEDVQIADQVEPGIEESDSGADASGPDVRQVEPIQWQTPRIVPPIDLVVLGEAVGRTASTLGSLRSFIDNEISAMKVAVERQAQ